MQDHAASVILQRLAPTGSSELDIDSCRAHHEHTAMMNKAQVYQNNGRAAQQRQVPAHVFAISSPPKTILRLAVAVTRQRLSIPRRASSQEASTILPAS